MRKMFVGQRTPVSSLTRAAYCETFAVLGRTKEVGHVTKEDHPRLYIVAEVLGWVHSYSRVSW